MNRLRVLQLVAGAVLAGASLTSLSSCGNSGNASVGFRDTHPLPADTMRFAIDEIGTYGGRFVIGETLGPKSFNGLIPNGKATTRNPNPEFYGLGHFDKPTQQRTPRVPKSRGRAPGRPRRTFA